MHEGDVHSHLVRQRCPGLYQGHHKEGSPEEEVGHQQQPKGTKPSETPALLALDIVLYGNNSVK